MKKTESLCCTPETQYCKSTVLQLKIKLSMTQYKMQTAWQITAKDIHLKYKSKRGSDGQKCEQSNISKCW